MKNAVQLFQFPSARESAAICSSLGPPLVGLRSKGRSGTVTCFALCALSTIVFGDPPQQPLPVRARIDLGSQSFDTSQALPENYILTLTITDKEQVISELSLVVATTDFSTVFPDVKSKFATLSGTVSLEEGGGVVLRYLLNWEMMAPAANQVVQYRPIQTRASVRLRSGEPIQILKCDTFACRISITRLSDEKGKDK